MPVPSKHAGSDPEAFWLRPVMAVTARVQPESARIVHAIFDFSQPFQFRFSKEGPDHTVQNRPGSDLDGLVGVWSNTSGLVGVWSNTSGLVGVWSNTSGLVGLIGVWSNTSGLVGVWSNTSGLVGVWSNTSGLVGVWSNTSGLVGVWSNTSGLGASRCAGITGPGFWQDATGPLPVSHFQTRFRTSTDVPDTTVQNQPGSDSVLADCVRFGPNLSGPEASRCAKLTRLASGQCLPADSDRMRIGSGMFTGWLYTCLLGGFTHVYWVALHSALYI